MKKLFLLSALLGAALSTSAFAVELTKGTVKKLDEKQMKVTIKHGPLKNLEMDGMTMVFAVKDLDVGQHRDPCGGMNFYHHQVSRRGTATAKRAPQSLT